MLDQLGFCPLGNVFMDIGFTNVHLRSGKTPSSKDWLIYSS